MKIVPMTADDALRYVATVGTTGEALKGKCYAVAFNAIMDPALADRYVLGWVTHAEDGKRTQHAWIKVGERYHDPLLQYLGYLDGATHEFVCELSKKDVVRMEVEHYGSENIARGCEVMPPELGPNDQVIINDPQTS